MRISGKTQLIGLFADPVKHSLSPAMHNTAFEQLGLDYRYLAFEVQDEDLSNALIGAKALNMRGFNVSMPHKQAIIPYLDDLSPAARLIGAVNTVVNENGRLIGHITDGSGAMRALTENGVRIENQTITLAGTGGAGFAIAIQAALDGAKQINIFNRKSGNFAKAQDLAEKINKKTNANAQAFDLEDQTLLTEKLQESSIFINATSVGMAPNTEECIIKDPKILHEKLVVMDIVYNPRQTKLLRIAKENDAKLAIDGLGMLLYQGSEAFKLWTGQEMPIKSVKDVLFKEE